MPTPVGHALGGVAAALAVKSLSRRPGLEPSDLLVAAVIAMTPDLDILAGSHRTATHSIGAAAIVALVSWLVLQLKRFETGLTSTTIAAAYGSHVLLDWLGRDSSPPSGEMALWPFTSRYYMLGWDLFHEVSRRYWQPREFVLGNLAALCWELAVLLPVVLVIWVVWSKQTLGTEGGKGRG